MGQRLRAASARDSLEWAGIRDAGGDSAGRRLQAQPTLKRGMLYERIATTGPGERSYARAALQSRAGGALRWHCLEVEYSCSCEQLLTAFTRLACMGTERPAGVQCVGVWSADFGRVEDVLVVRRAYSRWAGAAIRHS